MKTTKIIIAIFALILMCGNVEAQFQRRLGNAVKSAAENAAVRQAERKTEEAVNKAVNEATNPENYKDDEKDQASGSWKCSCGKKDNTGNFCTSCGKKKPVTDDGTWVCSSCGTKGNKGNFCNNCGANRGVDAAVKAINAATVDVDVSDGEIPEVANTPYTPSESEYAFFGMKKGLVQVFVQKDAKGKITSQTRTTITEITGNKTAFAVAYESETLDKNGKSADNPLILHYRIVVAKGVMFLDMKGMFGSMEGLDGISVSGAAMKIPSNLAVGQKLDDANASVRIGFIKMNVEMTEGKVLSYEDVTTEAGTFKCYKVTQTTKAMGVTGTTVNYYAKGVGAVKTESFDKNGKLISSTELVSMK
jgi:hypothetical protein